MHTPAPHQGCKSPDFALAGGVTFFAGLLVLGGDFCDKLRVVFVHAAVARFPEADA